MLSQPRKILQERRDRSLVGNCNDPQILRRMQNLVGPVSHNFTSFENPQGFLDIDGVTPVVPCGLRLRYNRLSEYDFNRVVEPNFELFCQRCVLYDCPDHFNFQVIPHGAIVPTVPVPFTVAHCKRGNSTTYMSYLYTVNPLS